MYLDADKFMNWILELMSPNNSHLDTSCVKISNYLVEKKYGWQQNNQNVSITVLEGKEWKLQFCGSVPKIINSNEIIHIPKFVYYRLINGNTPLKLKIEEV
jgi:hypothetical protein